jgi:hypothetical protein
MVTAPQVPLWSWWPTGGGKIGTGMPVGRHREFAMNRNQVIQPIWWVAFARPELLLSQPTWRRKLPLE